MEAFLVSTGVVAHGEMGDKTQIATVALAASCPDLVAVVSGTTLECAAGPHTHQRRSASWISER